MWPPHAGVESQLSSIGGDLSLIGVFPIAVLLYLHVQVHDVTH